jgi:hypothetical protein
MLDKKAMHPKKSRADLTSQHDLPISLGAFESDLYAMSVSRWFFRGIFMLSRK